MAKKTDEVRPSAVQVWILATRPNTLTLSFTPVLVGAALVAKELGRIEALPSVLFWIFAALIQIGTNLHNDYSDFVKGADTDERVGQARATQKGWLTAEQTLRGALTSLCGAVAVGAYLASRPGCAFFMTFVVITSTFNAVAYTGGFPLTLVGLGSLSLGYSGLGDLFVLLYFGYVATFVPFFLQLPQYPPFLLVIAATSMGFLASGVMVVNNLRDRRTDVKANKRTLAVRFGQKLARAQYAFLLVSFSKILHSFFLKVGAYAAPVAAVVSKCAPRSWLLVLLSLPLAVSLSFFEN